MDSSQTNPLEYNKPHSSQLSDVVFLADKLWQGPADRSQVATPSSVDMNQRLAKWYNNRKISYGEYSDRMFAIAGGGNNFNIKEQAEQESRVSNNSINEESSDKKEDGANFMMESS